MLTKIDLCSMALLKLGEAPIQSMADNGAAANIARTLFEPTIDALLAAHPWRFACKTFVLTKNTDGNFEIPAEALRIIKCDGRVVGNRIFAPGKTTSIIAVTRVGTECWPGYFASLAATRLAMEFCIPMSGDQTVFRMLVSLYESELQSAKFIDSGTSQNPGITDFSLISTRF